MTAELYERDDVMAIARDMLSHARSGHGGILVVEGPAGIGKSSVLDAIAAGTDGFQVARARPVELEREHPFGIVRTLFEPLLASLSEASASALAAGPGVAARRVLEDNDRAAGTTQSTFFGLFWLLALATNDAPVLLVIDDAQWADPPSLAWLTYIARRLPDLAAAVVCATRPESSSDAIDELLSAKDAVTVRPLTPLGAASVRAMIERSLGRRDAMERTADVMAATRGNPFLVTELLRASRNSTAHELVPAAATDLERQVISRVAQAAPQADKLAQAIAVLGGAGVNIAAAAALADLPASEALAAADALRRAGLLAEEAQLTFTHPLVREVVYANLGPLTQAAAHAEAARVLRGLGEADEAVAAHLLSGAPGGDPADVAVLRRAAARALARGAPGSSVRLLRRTLREPLSAGERSEVLGELGEAEARANDPAAEETLRAALADAPDRRFGETSLTLARLLTRTGRALEAAAVLRAARQRTVAGSEMALRLHAELLAAARAAPTHVTPLPLIAIDERSDLRGVTPGERLVLASLTYLTACSAAPAAQIADLAQRCLRDDLLLEEEGPEAHLVYFAIAALGFVDRYAEALRHLDAALAKARSAGSVGGYALARAWRADVLLRCGSLAEAEADALDALALAAEHGLEIVSALALFPLTVVRIESRRVAEAEADLTRQGFGDAIPELGAFAGLLFARGRLHRQLGRADRAHADFAAAGRALLRGNVSSPAIVPWRSDAALALAALGRAEEAATLAGKELELARALDAPRPLGLALRASALVGPDEERLPMLESAVEHLRAAGSSVELARTLIDVGIARLRRDERESGRAALREALDLADRHGAGSLADLAHQELLVAGARPRRRRIAGLDALTAAELRVARLAASGRTNREIASELFLTQKTVETHLGHVFAKLSLASRRELPGALHAGDG